MFRNKFEARSGQEAEEADFELYEEEYATHIPQGNSTTLWMSPFFEPLPFYRKFEIQKEYSQESQQRWHNIISSIANHHH